MRQRDIIVRGSIGGRTIQAIKALRGAAQLGLKEAKNIVDAGNMGGSPKVLVDIDALADDPSSEFLAYEIVPGDTGTLQGFIDKLSTFPPDMQVSDLLALLRVVAREFSA